jgi:protein-glutamine gamma-glutamyltransferase
VTLIAAYELGLLGSTLLGLLSVLAGGEMPLLTWLTLAAPIVSYLRGRERPLPLAIGTSFGAAGAIAAVASLWLQGIEALVLAAASFLLGLMVGRVLTRKTLDHDLQTVLLSLLLVFAGTILHTQITYAFVFVAFSLATVGCLVCRQLVVLAEREALVRGSLAHTLLRKDVVTPTFVLVTTSVALVLLVSTAALFVVFPRFGIGALGILRRGPQILPGTVSLAGAPRSGAGGGEVLARVRGLSFDDLARGLYLRGPVYDDAAHEGFVDSGRPEVVSRLPTGALVGGGREAEYDVFMQPVTLLTLMTLGPVKEARVVAGGTANPSSTSYVTRLGFEDSLRVAQPLLGPTRYKVWGKISRPGDQIAAKTAEMTPEEASSLAAALAPFLKVPGDLDPRIPELALATIGSARTSTEKASKLRAYLLDNFKYSLDQTNGNKQDPLAGFLFEDRQGHCEYFATAFAMMLRTVGVPSRVVGGFQGGLWDENGEVVVFTSENAHAWVEWHNPGVGWVVDDATPASFAPPLTLEGLPALIERARRAWDDYVVEYNLQQQTAIFERVRDTVRGRDLDILGGLSVKRVAAVAGLALGSIAVAYGIWRNLGHRRRRRRQISGLAREIQRALSRARGAPVEADRTFRETLLGLEAQGPLVAGRREALWRAIEVYERERFAEKPPSIVVRRRVVRALRR